MNYCLKKGLSRDKLILGIPFYGKTFTLQYANNSDIGAPIKGPGKGGYYTQRPGFLAYFEICDKDLDGGWKKFADSSGAPYVTNGDQWIGYDNAESVKQKVRRTS